ncbi:hypothetical protein ACH0BO_11350 [Brevibacterium luteolum]|uniref:hypothetical protein n=1 Tax=Brevibacterium luteolum TaxID=199591 RepID=UPI003879D7E4
MNQHSEYSQVARDPERRDKLIKALPLIAAVGLSLPLFWLSMRFSFIVGQVAYYVILMGASALNILGLGLISLLGALGLLGAFICLWRGVKRRTWKWRIGWSLGILGCALASAMPLILVFTGVVTGPPI